MLTYRMLWSAARGTNASEKTGGGTGKQCSRAKRSAIRRGGRVEARVCVCVCVVGRAGNLCCVTGWGVEAGEVRAGCGGECRGARLHHRYLCVQDLRRGWHVRFTLCVCCRRWNYGTRGEAHWWAAGSFGMASQCRLAWRYAIGSARGRSEVRRGPLVLCAVVGVTGSIRARASRASPSVGWGASWREVWKISHNGRDVQYDGCGRLRCGFVILGGWTCGRRGMLIWYAGE